MRLFLLRSLLAAVLGAALSSAAWAQFRQIPADAKPARMTVLQQNVVQLDDKQYLLAPGALIRDTSNIIVLPTMVPTRAPVRYQLDNMGQIKRVWLLSAAEAAQVEAQKPVPLPAPIQENKDEPRGDGLDDQ
ncbi:MAG TPA: hypothetical protein VKZ48_02360 [Burkholderiales bacterium]|nr:hypothetical protein [Burkholderiales bacterium]